MAYPHLPAGFALSQLSRQSWPQPTHFPGHGVPAVGAWGSREDLGGCFWGSFRTPQGSPSPASAGSPRMLPSRQCYKYEPLGRGDVRPAAPTHVCRERGHTARHPRPHTRATVGRKHRNSQKFGWGVFAKFGIRWSGWKKDGGSHRWWQREETPLVRGVGLGRAGTARRASLSVHFHA